MIDDWLLDERRILLCRGSRGSDFFKCHGRGPRYIGSYFGQAAIPPYLSGANFSIGDLSSLIRHRNDRYFDDKRSSLAQPRTTNRDATAVKLDDVFTNRQP
jgi:hypothetical protein